MQIKEVAGRNIRRIRRTLGWRQEELVAKSGVTQQYISGLENGQRNVSLTTLGKIAEALGVEPAELLKITEAPGPGPQPNLIARPKKARAG